MDQETRAVIAGLMRYADGHDLRGQWAEELRDLQERAARLLRESETRDVK